MSMAGYEHYESSKELIRAGNTGKVVSEESRKKMSDAARGKPKSEEHKKNKSTSALKFWDKVRGQELRIAELETLVASLQQPNI